MFKLNLNNIEQRIRDICTRTVNENKNFGIMFRIMQHGEIIADVSEGVRDPDSGDPVNGDTMFRLASMTKPVTSAAVMVARDKGLLKLTDAVSDYLPGFDDLWVGKLVDAPDGSRKFVKNYRASTTLRVWNLISHTSGIGSGEGGYVAQWDIDPQHRASLAAMAEYLPKNFLLDFEPGTKFAYSTMFGGDMAARVVEVVSGMPFNEFIRDNIFAPLGVDDVTFTPTEGQYARLSRMMNCDAQGNPVADDSLGRSTFENLPLSYFCGGASLCGSMNGYTRFAEMLRGNGQLDGVRILSEESAKLLHTPWIPRDMEGITPFDDWGLMMRITADNHPWLPKGIFGWSGAYGTVFWVDPVNDVTAVLMRNSRRGDVENADLAGEFERAMYEKAD